MGNTYPEITEMQTRAIIEAALAVKACGISVLPEIMVPLTSTAEEFECRKILSAKQQKVLSLQKASDRVIAFAQEQ